MTLFAVIRLLGFFKFLLPLNCQRLRFLKLGFQSFDQLIFLNNISVKCTGLTKRGVSSLLHFEIQCDTKKE